MKNFIKLITLINFIIIISFNVSKTKTDSYDDESNESTSIYTNSIEFNTEMFTQENLIATNYIKLPQVIVWELCGTLARAKRTKIFDFMLKDDKILFVWFDPIINSLIFEHNSTETILFIIEPNFDFLFFIFDRNNRIEILVNCPKFDQSRLSLTYDLSSEINEVHLFENSYSFTSLEKAFSSFKCASKLTVFPGLVVYFNEDFNQNVSFIFSIVNQDSISIYSFIYSNQNILVFEQDRFKTVPLDSKIENKFYLYFKKESVEIYLKCPYQNKPIGVWKTNIFNDKVNIKTSRSYQLAYCGSKNLMQAFCAIDNIKNQLNQNSILTKELESIENSNIYNSNYFPDQEKFEKIDSFKSVHALNSAYLMSPVHRILIASRVDAKQRFFDRSIKDYVNGFTDGINNFWIGLNILNEVTNRYNYTLRLETDNGSLAEEYKIFKVGNQSEGFKLTISNPIIKNCDGFKNHDNLKFSTFDFGPSSAQASNFRGGFWHKTDKNIFCLTCENLTSSNGTSALIYNFGTNRNGNNYNSYQSESYTSVLKMYLIP